MAILMFVARISNIRSSLYRKQQRLTQIVQKIADLQQYAASIGDGAVSLEELGNTPGSMFGRMYQFIVNSHDAAFMQSKQMFQDPGFQAMLGRQTQGMNPQDLAHYQAWMQQNLYFQARERIGKMEAQRLNAEEKKLVAEKDKLETSIKMEEADLKSAIDARDKGIEQFAPKYTG